MAHGRIEARSLTEWRDSVSYLGVGGAKHPEHVLPWAQFVGEGKYVGTWRGADRNGIGSV